MGTEGSRIPTTRTSQGKLKDCAQYILDYEAARGEVPAVTVLENAVALAQFVVTHDDWQHIASALTEALRNELAISRKQPLPSAREALAQFDEAAQFDGPSEWPGGGLGIADGAQSDGPVERENG